MSPPVVIFGCGYTGKRVAQRLRARGISTIATSRHQETRFQLGDDTSFVPAGAIILYSIPDVTDEFVLSLGNRPARVVHLSTTGVYGNSVDVDHTTPPRPITAREVERFRQETVIRSGPWPTLTLRPAAIYGPDRGVHVSMAKGEFRLAGDGSNYVSRIHVDDLAAHAEASLFSDVIGAYPVADEEPCPSADIAAYCAELLKLPIPESTSQRDLPATRQSNRRVDGSEIRRLLSVPLIYPSYRYGIPASLGIRT